jgi:hypothetical protein
MCTAYFYFKYIKNEIGGATGNININIRQQGIARFNR